MRCYSCSKFYKMTLAQQNECGHCIPFFCISLKSQLPLAGSFYSYLLVDGGSVYCEHIALLDHCLLFLVYFMAISKMMK
uniref:Uncharacterized protein n=1 Tax=Arundo donax TaxID=35708 RepID=A0A0A9EYF2_ARUDO